MNSKKKKTIKIFVTVGIIILISCFIIIGDNIYNMVHYADKTVAYEESWDIDLPDYIDVYETKTPFAWFNEGIKYTVFDLEEEPTDFIEDFLEDNDSDYQNVFKDICTSYEEILSIDNQYLPQWHEEYICKKISRNEGGDNLYMFYFQNTNKLILVQSIT